MTHGQKNVPTEQRSAQKKARFPRPHEDRQRTPRPEAPPRQGPEEIDGLTGARDEGFPRSDRLLNRREFEAVYARGVRVPARYFLLLILSNGGQRSRLGVTLGRRVGNAVVRNKARRRLREWFRHDADVRRAGVDIVVQASPKIAGVSLAALREEMSGAMARYAKHRSGTSRRPDAGGGKPGAGERKSR